MEVTCFLPKVLTIAGSDSSGGAGIQADIKTMSACHCYSASIITTLTAQNTSQVYAIQPVSDDMINQQLKAVLDDISFDAIKIGMLLNTRIIESIAENISLLKPCPFIILDPVMVSTSGSALLEEGALVALIKEIIPLSTLITPNILEAEHLLDEKIYTIEDTHLAAKKIVKSFGISCLLKGGHQKTLNNSSEIVDVLCLKEDNSTHFFPIKKIITENTHGTGCSLSAAIASFLAQGKPLVEAVGDAQKYVNQAIKAGKDMVWKGNGPIIHHFKNE